MIKKYLVCFLISKMLHASPLQVTGGGSGLSSMTAYAVLCGGTTNAAALQNVASVGSANQILTSNGAGSLPTFQSLASMQYANVYDTTGQTITAGSAMLFNSNGLMSSGITHSTSSNTDQIIINTTGIYLFIYHARTTSNAANFLGISVNGSVQAESTYTLSGASTSFYLCGHCILSITAADVIRVVNVSAATSMTLASTAITPGAIDIIQLT